MVTWSTYLSGVGVVLFIYYSIASLFFFRKEIFQKIKPAVPPVHIPSPLVALEEPTQEQQSNGGIQSLMDELEAYLEQVEVDISARELLAGIKKIIEKHAGGDKVDIHDNINRIILELTSARLNIVFDEEQLQTLWSS